MAATPEGHFIGTTVDSNVLVRKLREADGLKFGNSIVAGSVVVVVARVEFG